MLGGKRTVRHLVHGAVALAFVLFGLLVVSVGIGVAQTERRQIDAIYTQFPPFSFSAPDGPAGLSIEVMRALAEREGFDLTFAPVENPAEAISAMTAGEADVLMALGPTEARRQILGFSEILGVGRVVAIVDPVRHPGVLRVSDTDGLTMGYVSGSIATNFADAGPFEAVEVSTTDALVGQFLLGEIDGVLFVDAAFRRISWSADFADRVRLLEPSFRDLSLHLAMPLGGEDTDFLIDAMADFADTPEFLRIETKWLGEPDFWTTERVRLASMAMVLATFVVVAVFGIYRRFMARQSEAAQARLLRDVTGSLPFTVAMVDRAGGMQVLNRAEGDGDEFIAADRILGPNGDATPTNPAQLSPQAIAALQDRTTAEFDLPDGRAIKRWIAPLSDGAHLIVREDVTEERRIRQELMDQQSRLTAVMNAAQGGIIGLDHHGRVVIANPSARHLLGGISTSTPFAWPAAISFLDSEDLSPLDASLDPVNRALNGQILENEIAIMSRGGDSQPRYVRLSSANIPDGQSADVATVLILNDVTEEERNRQQLERSSRLDALGQLTGGIAHDFNNLLATILYGIQLSQKTDDPEKHALYIQTAEDSVQRGTDLTQRLLAFAKRQPGHEAAANVKRLINEMAKIAEAAVQEQITLDFEPVDAGIWVHCDVAQLENAVLNLILNARDAILETGRGDRISIAVRQIPGTILYDPDRQNESVLETDVTTVSDVDRDAVYAEVSVTDNGPGMTEEVKRRAIDPFFSTKDAAFGSGLGLSIVYGFAKQSGGYLRIYSIPGDGTTVRLILPLVDPADETEGPEAPREAPLGNGETVLIVEDEIGLLAMMQDVIEGLNYATMTAPDGPSAMEILRSDVRVDVLMTDIVMPGGLGGFRLAKAACDLRPDLAVVYMSGYTGFSESEMGDVPGPLIQKPSAPTDVAEMLQSVLSQRKDRSE